MNIFRNVVFVAALAGLVAGVVLAALQAYATVPLIHQAEVYEQAAGGEETAASGHDHGAAGHDHAAADHDHAATTEASGAQSAAEPHEHGGWEPTDGFERTAFTALSDVVTGIGFALILVAVSEMLGGITSWRNGLFWGFAGFAVFTLAPGLGLPPELPAMPAADLTARQIWWVGTALATAAGLGLIAFKRNLWLNILGVAAIVAPHVMGAPQPASFETPIPEGLHHQFVVAVTVTNLIFWLVLGSVAGLLRNRFMSEAHPVEINGRLA